MKLFTLRRPTDAERLPVYTGTGLIVLGLLLNKFMIEWLITASPNKTSDHSIESPALNGLIILTEVTLVAAGSYLLLRRPEIRIGLSELTLLSASTIAALVVVEIVLNIWLSNFASVEHLTTYGTLEQITENRRLRISADRYLGYINTQNFSSPEGNQHNSLGYRGEEIVIPKPANRFRIALIGGSTTYTTEVEDYTKAYPFQLQTILRDQGYDSVEVVNAGVQSYSSWESLINLQFRVLDIEPDLVIVYHGINDLVDRFVLPFSSYRGDNSGSRDPLIGNNDTVWDHFAVTRIAKQVLGFRTSEKWIRTYRGVDSNVWLDFAYQDQEWQVNPTSSSGDKHETISASQLLERNRPKYFDRNLRNMNAIASEHRIPTVLMTFAFSTEASKEIVATKSLFSAALSENNGTVMSVCRSSSAICYDFASDMPKDAVFWTRDGIHLNIKGARKKAELVAQYLLEANLLPTSQTNN